MKRVSFLAFIAFGISFANAQELYPNSEPASIIPKKALGVRIMNEAYVLPAIYKSWHGAMLMYGVSSKLMLSGMFTTSNHHYKNLPDDFIQIDSNQVERIKTIPEAKSKYLFESINLGFRYRFLNIDGDHKHFRMALYSNGVYAFQPHDEAEVSLMGDNKALGGGIISTFLIKKLAISFTGGLIKPFSFKDYPSNVSLNYSNAYNYSLSFGYLVYPFKYKNFNQTNINLYTEVLGKTYSALDIRRGNNSILMPLDNKYKSGNYLELRPAIQFIIKSNLRIDCSTAFPLVNRSYIRNYPLYLLNIQYYFFL